MSLGERFLWQMKVDLEALCRDQTKIVKRDNDLDQQKPAPPDSAYPALRRPPRRACPIPRDRQPYSPTPPSDGPGQRTGLEPRSNRAK
jgi:hypothetical protein